MNKFIKKVFAVVTAAIFAVSGSVSAFALDWEAHWAADYIRSAREAGWADMREKNNFDPSAFATREEVVYMIYASQLKSASTPLYMEITDDLSKYTDANNINSKYLAAFRTLVGNKMLSGYNDNTLKPQGYVTRAEMAKLISFLIPSAILSKTYYGYSDELPQWAAIDIERCSRSGIVSGYPDNTFRASNYISRGEVVRMIQGLLQFRASVETTTEESTKHKAVPQTTTKSQTTTEKRAKTTEAATETTTRERHLPKRLETTTEAKAEKPNDMKAANELYNLISSKRYENGSSALKLDDALCDLAYLKAKDMYLTNYNQVYSTSYGALENVLGKAGIKYMQCDMVIASSIFTPSDALTAFESNREYDNILLESNFTRIGVGMYEDRWVAILIRAVGD